METHIDYYYNASPTLKITIEGNSNYGFSLFGFPSDRYEWLREVLGKQMQELYDRGFKDGKLSVQNKIKETFNFLK